MQAPWLRRGVAIVAAAALLAGCDPAPTPSPTTGAVASPTPEPTAVAPSPTPTTAPPTPSPTLDPTTEFPLAVVTGLTNLKAWTDVAELDDLAADGRLIVPCGIEVLEPDLRAPRSCVPADEVVAAIVADPGIVALLPPGLVEPATKLLPIGGDGPFGLGGADLFGSAESRTQAYPVLGRATGEAALDPAWVAHDPSSVWTVASVGGTCLDGFVGYAGRDRGWDWVMDGGTARYRRIFLNPNPPAGVSREVIVDAVATGNRGALARRVGAADVTVDDFDCTLNEDWRPNLGGSLIFSTSSEAVPLFRDKLGFDVMKLAGNHASDFGAAGTRTTLRLLRQAGIHGVGVGRDLDEALEPATMDVAGLRVGFVAWNDVSGSIRAGDGQPGVAWLERDNVVESVRRARDRGADVVLCVPEWWGGAEYHSDLAPGQVRQLGWLDAAGCDHVLGHGTHVAGPLLLRDRPDGGGVSLVMGSHGNFLFGQSWWQQVQEGVILEASFRGRVLVNVRLHPYVLLDNAQPSLTDPEGDGRHVLDRVWDHSEVGYRP